MKPQSETSDITRRHLAPRSSALILVANSHFASTVLVPEPMDSSNGRSDDVMAKIRASCPTCGDVELTTKDVVVRVCADDNTGSYSFGCPQCAVRVVKTAEQHVLDLLGGSGVDVVVWTLPAELAERRGGGPITHDDLMDFHDLLQNDDALQEALSASTSDRYDGEAN
jgi:hypothetical protein